VITICGANPFFLSWPAKPALLAHDAVNFFVIDQPSFAFELFGHPAVSILGKVQANLLDTVDQRLI
jgi:hypothetical protein